MTENTERTTEGSAYATFEKVCDASGDNRFANRIFWFAVIVGLLTACGQLNNWRLM